MLAQALLAESNKEWLESLALCQRARAISPDHPEVLNLLGRLVRLGGDPTRAIGLQRVVLRLQPGHRKAADDLRLALAAIRSPEQAHKAYQTAIDIEPDIQCHHRHPGSLEPFAGIERAQEALHSALAWDPSHALAQAAIGNLHARHERYASALDAYGVAVMLEPNLPDVHLALAELLELVHEQDAARHRETALAGKQVYPAGAVSISASRSVLVLMSPGAFSNMNVRRDGIRNRPGLFRRRLHLALRRARRRVRNRAGNAGSLPRIARRVFL